MPVHASMYRDLWSNGPKECLEIPTYTFLEHFGKDIPSFPPRAVLESYIKGRAKKNNLSQYIQFNHTVTWVRYNEETEKFEVTVKDTEKDENKEGLEYEYVVVANGHYSTPSLPSFPGIPSFPGRIIHSHDFRNAREFVGQHLLVIGSSYSAEDVALQTSKYGAASVTCTYRTKPMDFKWPEGIDERPLLTQIRGNTVYFSDGSEKDFDVIIMCTGYLNSYPFLADPLRLKTKNTLYPPLFKGVVWPENTKLFYLGMQDQFYTFTLFEVQAYYVAQILEGHIDLPSADEMKDDVLQWIQKEATITTCFDAIDFQTAHIEDLRNESKYAHKLDVSKEFYEWEKDKKRDIVGYRDKSFTSIYTNSKAPLHHTPWWLATDDSYESFVDQQQRE